MEMHTVSDHILTRFNARRLGEETLGLNYRPDVLTEDLEYLLSRAEAKAYQNGYWDIYSCRKVIGPVIVFLKKCVRKLLKTFLGWYIFPIYEKQSEFNQLALDIIRKQNNTILLMQGHIEMLEKRTAIEQDMNLEEK